MHEAIAASTSKRLLQADPRPRLPASIQDEIHRLRSQWQLTWVPAMYAQVNCFKRSATYRLNE